MFYYIYFFFDFKFNTMSNTMSDKNSVNFTRREFLGTVAAAAAFTIVPRSVLGGPGLRHLAIWSIWPVSVWVAKVVAIYRISLLRMYLLKGDLLVEAVC